MNVSLSPPPRGYGSPQGHLNTVLLQGVDHSKVLGVKKREFIGVFVWSKVFLDRGIANRTIGQSLRVDFPKSKQTYIITKTTKKEGKTLIYWPSCTAGDDLLATVNGFGFDVAACAPPCLRRGIRVRPCILRLCVYLPCGLQVQPLDLSWPCLLRATGHWGGVWCETGARV